MFIDAHTKLVLLVIAVERKRPERGAKLNARDFEHRRRLC